MPIGEAGPRPRRAWARRQGSSMTGGRSFIPDPQIVSGLAINVCTRKKWGHLGEFYRVNCQPRWRFLIGQTLCFPFHLPSCHFTFAKIPVSRHYCYEHLSQNRTQNTSSSNTCCVSSSSVYRCGNWGLEIVFGVHRIGSSSAETGNRCLPSRKAGRRLSLPLTLVCMKGSVWDFQTWRGEFPEMGFLCGVLPNWRMVEISPGLFRKPLC